MNSLIITSIDIVKLERIAKLLASYLKKGDIILLGGDLGAGKTTFTQFLAQEMNVDEKEYVSSPSYALLHEYTATIPFYHMDLYRLHDADDVEDAGLLEYMYAEGLCVVEWPERLGINKPNEYLAINFEIVEADSRNIDFFLCGKRWGQKQSMFKELSLL